MSKRHYSDRWSYKDTKLFIEVRIKLDSLFIQRMFDVRTSWEAVGEEASIQQDWIKMREKLTNIMTKYKSIIEPPTGQSTEDDGPAALTWPHSEMVHEYAAGRHNISPPLVHDTATAISDLEVAAGGTDGSQPSTSSRSASWSRSRSGSSKTTDSKRLIKRAAKFFIMEIKHNICVSSDEDE